MPNCLLIYSLAHWLLTNLSAGHEHPFWTYGSQISVSKQKKNYTTRIGHDGCYCVEDACTVHMHRRLHLPVSIRSSGFNECRVPVRAISVVHWPFRNTVKFNSALHDSFPSSESFSFYPYLIDRIHVLTLTLKPSRKFHICKSFFRSVRYVIIGGGVYYIYKALTLLRLIFVSQVKRFNFQWPCHCQNEPFQNVHGLCLESDQRDYWKVCYSIQWRRYIGAWGTCPLRKKRGKRGEK